MKKVAILTYNHAALFELGCAVELFALPRPEFEHWYDCDVVALDHGPHQTTGGLQLITQQVDSLEAYDMLVIPSWPTNISALRGNFARQIQQFHAAGKRILSFCSGAFLLAQLGILDGHKATTHWRYADKFKRRFSKVDYVDDVLYVYDGQLGCSAGSAAAIDLGLEVIRNDFGQTAASMVARRLVMSSHRPGGQAQYVEQTPVLVAQARSKQTPFRQALDWALANLARSFTIDTLAARASMSRRTFDRRFRQHFNQSPKDWLTEQKLGLARQLLETEQHPMQQVAELSGFDNPTTMRHHFRKHLGVSPRQYRDQFAA